MSTPEKPSVEWRREPPTLTGSAVVLREPTAADVASLLDVLSIADASRFGLELPLMEDHVVNLVARFRSEREGGRGIAFAVTAHGAIVGLFHVWQLDPGFEAAEWECTLVPSVRGTGIFMDAARLVGAFVFGDLGAHRLEARALLQNGRANGALRKLGAVQEGVLRRAVLRGGDYQDQVLWSLLKEDWGGRFVPSSVRVH